MSVLHKAKPSRAKRRSVAELSADIGPTSIFIRERRKLLNYTQAELAERTGTSLNFIKAIELGKTSSRMDTVNQVLAFFGAHLAPVKDERPRED